MTVSDHTKHLDSLTLSMMVDDMLSQQESVKCHQHLSECKQCEQAYDDLVAMSFAMAKLPVVKPPADMIESIMSNLPPQDQVDSGKIIEIKEHHVKKDFFASLDMRQIACFAACVLLGGSFFMSPPSMETVEREGASLQQEGDMVSSNMLREMPSSDENAEDSVGFSLDQSDGEMDPQVASSPVMEMETVEEDGAEIAVPAGVSVASETDVDGLHEDERTILLPKDGLELLSLQLNERALNDSFWSVEPVPEVALLLNGDPEGTVLGDIYGEEVWVISEEVPDVAWLQLNFSEDMDDVLFDYLLEQYVALEERVGISGGTELVLLYSLG